MRTALFLLGLLTMGTMMARAAPPETRMYVATNGNDNWSGHPAAPNARRTDGPFATVQRAQEAVRALRKSGDSKPLTVTLRGGTYYLKTPLIFTPEDSGLSAVTTYEAMAGEKPVISGGERIAGWKMDAQGRWQTTLPEVQSGNWYFSQLFAGEQRRFRPRLPKQGYAYVAGALAPSGKAQGKGFDQFRFAPGAFHADWHNVGDIETLCFQIWTMARFRIADIDDANRTVRFLGDTHSTEAYMAMSKGKRYLVENVREALSDPGEWYLDRKSGALTYIPKPGETPDRTVIVAPRLEHLVELRGDIAKRAWVQNIRFLGLTFAHTNWNCPVEGNDSGQAEVNLGAVITAVGARGCRWDHCTIAHTGTYGLEWGEGCRNNALLASDLFDLGAGGVKIGTQGIPGDAEALASHNRVYDCRITQGGRIHPAGVGVWIGHSPDNEIVHNDLSDLYYSGLSVGWSWGYGPSEAHGNHLDFNRIRQIGQGVLSDMGGIYTLGLAPGTTERGNVIHDIESFDYGGWGIYPDEGSTGLLIENNLVYRTKTGGLHQHYGKDNIVRNNIFAFSRAGQIIRTRAEDHRSFTFEHNIVYFNQGTLLGSNWTGAGFALDNNLYWNAAGQPLDFAGATLAQWQGKGQDVHSQVADPQFIAPEKGDFHLKPGSPALALGFQPFDMSHAGAVSKRAALPEAPRAFPGPPAPPPPMRFDDLRCSKEFRKLTWWGFISDADANTVFYIDDLRLIPQK
ncbi:MAG: putative pectin lyase [Chthonomonadaceae bacterium]|nr:putative pectin lyase [Chthonomonadaceae bacterium]